MGTAPDAIKRLIDHFDRQSDQVRSPDYNEAQLRIDFINPMFRELGWDVDNTQGFAEQYREVVYEDRLKVGGATKAPDYSFRIGGPRKFFLEAKKPSVKIKESVEPAYQLRRYGWSAKLAVSLLTNFEEFAVYDCRIQPKQLDKASTARREYITYKQYDDRWDFLSGTFSKQAVLRGDFDRYCGAARGKGAQEFDDAFLAEIEEWRIKLASNLALRNGSLDERSLNFAVQRIIDRIILLRICEDRGIERVGRLQALLSGDAVYPRLIRLFEDADARYNSGLFHFKAEKGRDESPDELTPGLDVDDASLKSIITRLYYPASPYEFTVVSADILGSVYERFLGKVITLTAGHRAKVEEKPEVRKAGGVYYTPTYIVDYIVQQTVGKLLENKTPKEAAKLTILDPACGSGSFLLGAYQYLLDWHLKWYIADGAGNWSKGKKATLRPGTDGQWRLAINERKRILLDNIHGVDIDYQAVEVTKLSLLLKVLEGETAETLGGLWAVSHERALPDLGRNIMNGNSLIGTEVMLRPEWETMSDDEKRRVNPFDFDKAFPTVFKRSGFDAVIGNPPYVRQESITASKPYLEARFAAYDGVADLYAFFIEKGLRLLRNSGRFSYVVSSSFLKTTFAQSLRRFLSEGYSCESLVDFGGLAVFEAAKDTYVCIPVFVRADSHPPVRITKVHSLKAINLQSSVVADSYEVPANFLRESGWAIDNPTATRLFEKLCNESIPLGKYVGNNFFRGVTTGLNDAFIIDDATRAKLIGEDDNSASIIKPFLRGEDVRRFHVEPTKLWMIFARRGIGIGDFPAVKRHLAKWREDLMPRSLDAQRGRKPGRYKWYEIQDDTAYFELFDRPKIIYPDITKGPRFHLDDNGHYPANTVYCIGSADRRLLGILNSRLFWFFIAKISIPFGIRAGQYRYRLISQYMEQVPIRLDPVHPEIGENLIRPVNSAIKLHKLQQVTTLPQAKDQVRRLIDATDRQIDDLVYELYGLTAEEIRIVESATAAPDV